MLDRRDLRRVAAIFGAADDQVRRDHLISHVLHAIASLRELDHLGLVFYGGTALSRTFPVDGRLSEDIDLYATDRGGAFRVIENGMARAVRQEFPKLRLSRGSEAKGELAPMMLDDGTGVAIHVQLLRSDDTYRRWPTERRTLHERYSDVAQTTLTVPTRPAFTAMKAAAWRDRKAARDLFDLHLLAERGAIDVEAHELLRTVTGASVGPQDFSTLPHDLAWEQQLAHQTSRLPPAETCRQQIADAWAAAHS